ncbi:hypothetical protein HPB52_023333 [Rhipicephalus sanguineus]|uniref:Uncharacterized protein n=1 Tax=Rhipicephalus sanguineus TaxID=34632 RepID=A0A9D4QCP2_RHISA|nr:hypothetical protein HPB52_023333 [Rhipicephalus sanguineus]
MTALKGSPGPRSSNAAWKIDPNLLQDEDSMDHVRDPLQESLENDPLVTPLAWDTLKVTWKPIIQDARRVLRPVVWPSPSDTARRHNMATRMFFASVSPAAERTLSRAVLAHVASYVQSSGPRRRTPPVDTTVALVYLEVASGPCGSSPPHKASYRVFGRPRGAHTTEEQTSREQPRGAESWTHYEGRVAEGQTHYRSSGLGPPAGRGDPRERGW